MRIPQTLFLLLFLVVHPFLNIQGQQPGNRQLPVPVRTKALTENARAIDSLQSLNGRNIVSLRRETPGRPVGAKLVRRENPAVNDRRQNPAAGTLLNNNQLDFASRTNAICYTISGRNFLKQDSLVLYAWDPCFTSDGNVIVSGEFVSYSSSPIELGAFCMKTDIEGNVIWAKLYDSTADVSYDFINYFKSIELADGNILLAGRTTNNVSGNNDFLLTKLDNNGNTIWLKTYESKFWRGFNGSGDHFYLTSLEEDPATGDIYVAAGHWEGFSCVTKFAAADGQIIWSNAYDGYDGEQPFGLVINSNHLLLFDLINASSNNSYVHVTGLNKSNGDTLFTKTIRQTGDLSASRLYRGTQVVKLNNGHYRMGGPTTRYLQFPIYTGTIDLFHAGIIELDENVNFVKAWGFKNRLESNGYNTKLSLFPDGSGVFSMLDYISGYTGEGQVCLFRDDLIYHNRKRLHNNEGIPYEPPSLQLADGGFLNIKTMGDSLVNGVDGSRIDYYRMHTSDTGSVCMGIKDTATSIWYFNFEPVTRRIDSVHRNVLRESRVKQFDTWDFSLSPDPSCVVSSNCDTLYLSASAVTICPGNSVIITVHKNRECGSLVPLVYNNSFVNQVTRLSDSTYEFHFSTPGSGYIHASLMGCVWMKDSVFIEVIPAIHSLDLGADTVLCPGNQVALHAGAGFASYVWQDGSVDSIFIATTPGTYYVTAINSCGTSYTDTILVNDHPPIPLSIGPDRTKCNSDSIQLSGPSGFISYSWSPAYQVSSTTSQTISVNPAVDTSYRLRAELTPGCFAFDTVRITVYRSPAINLGADTSFCQGDSIILNAGTGFTQYSWSSGGTGQQVTVFGSGNYFVEAVTADGCKSVDTLRVLNVFNIPAVNLNPDNTLCTGTTRLLDAGPGFSTYAWNTGSSGQSVSVSTTGIYSVTVMDSNGCFGYDSSVINTLLPVPAGFLPPDTAICSYGSLQLKPLADYNIYSWSTGGTASSITITQPGTYWLQVTDGNNCRGRDSVLVQPKECMKGFYIPAAFTPNRDGKNDSFMPLLFGNIRQYQFSVYNRWGQVVFSSSIPGQGWDGNFGGIAEPSNVFIWTCHYQLEGEEKKMEKGTVLLVR